MSIVKNRIGQAVIFSDDTARLYTASVALSWLFDRPLVLRQWGAYQLLKQGLASHQSLRLEKT